MADFGPQATQLSAPQGAGSAPLAPVQEQAVNTSMMPLLASAADSIGRGIGAIMANRADEQRLKVQKDHAEGIQVYNNMLESGDITLSEYNARSRLHNDQYGSAFPSMKKEFEANIEMASLGRAGAFKEQIKTNEDIQVDRIKAMNKMGIDITFNDPPELRKAAEEKYNQMLRLNAYSDSLVKEYNAKKVMTEIEKEQQGTEAHVELSKYASKETDYVYKMAEDLGRKVRSGAVTYDQAKLRMDRIFTQIDLSLNEMAGVNKDSADRFRKTFDQTSKNVYSLIDPKTDYEAQKAMNDKAVEAARGRALIRDPRLADTLFQLETMKGAPDIVRNKFVTSGGLESFVKMFSTPSARAAAGGIPSVVGTRDEPATVEATKNILKSSINNIEFKDSAYNAVANYSQQIANGAAGDNPSNLKKAAELYSSAEFGNWIASQDQNADLATVSNAGKIVNQQYESVVKLKVEESIKVAETQIAGLPAVGAMGRSMTDPNSSALTTPRVNPANPGFTLSVTNNGRVRFEPTSQPATAAEARDQKALMSQLKEAEDGINQIVRINTHISRSTDYAADWEKNKSKYIPYMFPYNKGDVVTHPNGNKYEYVGKTDAFDYRAPASWKPVKAEETPNYGNRADGTQKGTGYFGEIKVPGTNNIATEYSVGVNINGKDVEIPTLVPTLNKTEIDTLLTAIKDNGRIPEPILNKAVDYAKGRIKVGKSPFADRNERFNIPKE